MRKKGGLFAAAALLFAVLCLPPAMTAAMTAARAAAPLLDAPLLERLRARASTVRNIRSEFAQETRIPMFTQPMRSKGRFLFMRPDALLWEYTEPMEEGFVLMGDKGRRWDDGKASHKPFTPGSDPVAAIIARQLVAWITLDTDTLGKEYAIAAVRREPLQLRMTPLRKDVAEVIESITITFTPEGPASLVEMRERRGGVTTITFTRTAVNGPVDAAAFGQP